jgi:hypothetical protein
MDELAVVTDASVARLVQVRGAILRRARGHGLDNAYMHPITGSLELAPFVARLQRFSFSFGFVFNLLFPLS